ncbi:MULTISPECIES: 2OG-Fe(II) oxygenase [Myxococcaceae]|uniref:2OG-Fe(II) oxygenase n=1 Tax=Myxococcaceae TaxID=31 RepID=UPI00188E56FA|nr:2OG-Fe(II) oxygenase [Simulacricoccus sp. 17bor-14]
MQTGLPCFLVREALSRAECAEVISEAEAAHFSATGRDYPPSYRDNDRLVRDDAGLAERLFARLRPLLPAQLEDAQGRHWRLHGLNPRFRYCRYREGQRFCIHQDGAWSPRPGVRSQLTLMLYLNDARDFRGGHTRYYAERGADSALLGTVQPEAGTAIVFDHALWHDGEAVTQGTKYVMRTDVLYTCEDAAPHHEPHVLGAHEGYVWSVLALQDGRLATGSRDCTVRLWRRAGEGWQPDGELRGHTASVVALAQDAGGRLWSGSRDRRVLCWEGGRPREVGRHAGAVLCLARVAPGLLASGGADGLIRLWSEEGKAAGVLEGHAGWVWSLAGLPGGRLASASEDGTLRVWDLARRREEARPVEAGPPLRALAAAADGALYAGDAEGRITRLLRGTPAQRAAVHSGAVCALALRADGTLASGGEDDLLRLLDAAQLTPRGTHPHGAFVRSLATLRDGRLASASYDGTVRLWP